MDRFFNKKATEQIEELKTTLINASSKSPVSVLPIIMQEVLQGIEDKNSMKL